MKREDILTSFLIPVDGSDCSKKSLCFSGTLLASIGARCKAVTLLNVLAGGYLSEHLSNIDIRAEYLIDSEQFKKIKEEHAKRQIMPILDEAAQKLLDMGVKANIEKLITDGDPADQIAKIAIERNFSTIIIGRRGLSPFKELFFGSVTDSLLHRDLETSIYVIGSNQAHIPPCPPRRVLVAIDGSAPSMAALEEAAVLSHILKDYVESFIMLHVINLARYAEHIEIGMKPEAEANEILTEAEERIVDLGVDPKIVDTVIKYGRPVETICEEVSSRNIDLLFVGRSGRSRIEELVLGSVSRGVLHRCHGPIIAVIGRDPDKIK